MELNILGTEYDFIETTEKEEETLRGVDGYCSYHGKYILVEKDIYPSDERATVQDREEGRKYVKRHEIIHAFWNECGLKESSINEEWAVNALTTQFPKMLKAFQEVDAI